MIHLYYGDGKGKTTAAVGLCIRMHGANKSIIFAQFLKDGSSAEVGVLKRLPNMRVLNCGIDKFVKDMSAEERLECTKRSIKLLLYAREADLIVLDEILDAVQLGIISLNDLLEYLDCTNAEVVLTGRHAPQEVVLRAHYITHMQNEKHPYENGVMARQGIEY